MRMVIALTALCACSSDRTYALGELDAKHYTFGLPVTGTGKLVVSESLVAPDDWSTVHGVAAFGCDDCVLGDDRTGVGDLFGFGSDIPFGHIAFDSVYGRAELADGKLSVRVEWRSADLDLVASIDGTLAKRADDIQLHGCVTWRPAAALRERDPKLYALFSVLGAPVDDAGWFHVEVQGTVGDPRRLALPCTVAR
jgi:hypothetical protein